MTMAKIIKLKPKPHCYVCGKEVGEDDFIDGPEIHICWDCLNKWQERCYKLLEQMKEENKK